jgi:hypothetical protein
MLGVAVDVEDTEGDGEIVSVVVIVSDGVAVADSVNVTVDDADDDSVAVTVDDALSEGVSVHDCDVAGVRVVVADRPTVPETAGVNDCVVDVVVLADSEGDKVVVADVETDMVSVGVSVRVPDDVMDGVSEPELLIEVVKSALDDIDAVCVTVGDDEKEAETVGLDDDVVLTEAEPLTVAVGARTVGDDDCEPVCVGLCDSEKDSDADVVIVTVTIDVAEFEAHSELVADVEKLAVGDAVSDGLADTDVDVVPDADTDTVKDGELLTVSVGETDGERLADPVLDGLFVVDGHGDGVREIEPLGVAELDVDCVGLCVKVALTERETVPVGHDDCDAVMVRLPEPHGELDGVVDGQRDTVCVGDLTGDADGELVAEPEAVPFATLPAKPPAPPVTDGAEVSDMLGDDEYETETVLETDAVPHCVGELDAVLVTDAHDDDDIDPECDPDTLVEPVWVADTEPLREPLGELDAVRDGEALGVGEIVLDRRAVADALPDVLDVTERDGVPPTVRVVLRETVGDGLREPDTVTDGEVEDDVVVDVLPVREPVTDVDGERLCVVVTDCEGDTVDVLDRVKDAVGELDRELESEPLADPVTEAEAETEPDGDAEFSPHVILPTALLQTPVTHSASASQSAPWM